MVVYAVRSAQAVRSARAAWSSAMTAPRCSAKVGPHHIAIDLTPILPRSESGGAKLVALTLVRQLGRLAPGCKFTLLTLTQNHNELSMLDAENVKRLRVDGENRTLKLSTADGRIGADARGHGRQVLRSIGADLLFCPLTAPTFHDPRSPVVSVVYDLQHLRFPKFFTSTERAVRARQLAETAKVADRIVCISDFTRSTLIRDIDVRGEQAVTIPVAYAGSLNRSFGSRDTSILGRLGIEARRFLLYPANFWPHKNHRLLLAALALYRARHPRSDLALVCTGSPGRHMDEVRNVAHRAGVGPWVRFPGFVTDAELAALMEASLALIFPSLYEGFGMPILEAMAFGTPVLSSNAASLPEVVGDAALQFDPNRPVEMMDAIEAIERDSNLRAELVERGRARLAAFDDLDGMARCYLELFRQVVGGPHVLADRLYGVDADGWSGERLIVTYAPSPRERYLDAVLTAPAWLPYGEAGAQVVTDSPDKGETFLIRPGRFVRITRPLLPDGGWIDIAFDRLFRPRAYGLSADSRMLGCVVQACSIVSGTESIDLLNDLRWATRGGADTPIRGANQAFPDGHET